MDTTPKILLVDDEPFNLDYLEQELEDLELEILTASNGVQALEVINDHQPDMILLDIMMPVMDGFEVLRRLKENPEWNSIPVVIISAASDLSSVVRGIELGAEDYLPKPFDPVLLHARVNAGLEKKRLRDIEQAYLKSLERELEIGREIQQGFLPRAIPQPEGWEIAAFFQAAREVAGDFYDVFELDEYKIALLLGDVTDKGVGSALYMALFRSLLRSAMTFSINNEMDQSTGAFTNQQSNPLKSEARLEHAVRMVNDYICKVHDSAMYATLFFGVLDIKSGLLCYINAGHDTPYVLRNGTVHIRLGPTGPMVGAFEEASYNVQPLRLEGGDTLVLYSDGITEAQNTAGVMLGKERWADLLGVTPPNSQRQLDYLKENVLNFVGFAPQTDDISLLTVRRISI